MRAADREHGPSVGSLGLNDRGEEVLAYRDVHSFAICFTKRQETRRPSAKIDEDFVTTDGCDDAFDDFAWTEWPQRALAGLDVREQLLHRLGIDGHPSASGQTTCHRGLLGALPRDPCHTRIPGLDSGKRRGAREGHRQLDGALARATLPHRRSSSR